MTNNTDRPSAIDRLQYDAKPTPGPVQRAGDEGAGPDIDTLMCCGCARLATWGKQSILAGPP
jgi:hypothetical protein